MLFLICNVTFLWSKRWAHQGRCLSPMRTLLAIGPSCGDLQHCALRIISGDHLYILYTIGILPGLYPISVQFCFIHISSISLYAPSWSNTQSYMMIRYGCDLIVVSVRGHSIASEN